MSAPISVTHNDYRANPKRSDIYTPKPVGQFVHDVMRTIPGRFNTVLDPAIGAGALTDPWVDEAAVIGCDIVRHEHLLCDKYLEGPFEDIKEWPCNRPDLIVCNPPFNQGAGKMLYAERFLRHIDELFGPFIPPTVLFTPMGFRLNQRVRSNRWRWVRDSTLEISSIISLPLDIFPDVMFHVEILVFNGGANLKPHYYLPEWVVRACGCEPQEKES